MEFTALVERLEDRLRGPLPGPPAQLTMAPRPPRTWPPGVSPDQARQAAGLLLIFAIQSRAFIALTVRARGLDRHGGQVSLPGGVIEPGETFDQAALREAEEEIGLNVQTVRCLGPLTPIDIPVSGFRLHPIVAVAPTRPHLVPSAGEVARILEVSVDSLMEEGRTAWRNVTRDGRTLEFPAFLIEDVDIWGATAMVLAEFLTLLGWKGPDFKV